MPNECPSLPLMRSDRLRQPEVCDGTARVLATLFRTSRALSAHGLVAIVKKPFHFSASLYEIEILQILSQTMFEKAPLDQLLAQTMNCEILQSFAN